MGKMKIHELAKEIDKTSKEIITVAQELGIEAKSHMSSLEDKDIEKIKNKDGEIFIDRTGKADGRGAYICDQIECLEKIIKSKRLEKVLEVKIPEEVYNNLRGVIIDK